MNSIDLKTRTGLNLFRIYRSIQSKLHELNYLFWECTLRCNLNCIHCGSDCKKDSLIQDMPLNDFIRVVDEIKNHVNPNKTMVSITGGEPLIRKDLEKCGQELYKRGFPWGIVSNGFVLSIERLESLLQSGLRSITISLDGLTESHDWFRGMKGSFLKAYNAINLCAKTPDLIFDTVTCINQKNFNELEKIRDLLIDANVEKWRIFTVFPKGRAKDNNLLKLNNNQFRHLLEFIEKNRKDGKIHVSYGCEGFLGKYEGKVRDSFFFCRAGINIGSVLNDGSVSACPSLRNDYIQGNIYKDSFIDCWNNRFQIMRNRKWTKNDICASCKVYKWCNGNGLHLRDEKSKKLLLCQYNMLCN